MLSVGGKMEQSDVIITHETLFEILKREKDKTDLVKLDNTFFTDVVNYLKEKSRVIYDKGELFTSDEKKNTIRQIENAKKILRGIYDIRERKIISLALDKSRTKSSLIDSSGLLFEEKLMFDKLVEIFNSFRDDIINNLLNENLPEIKQDKRDIRINVEHSGDLKKETKLVRFIHAVPKFVGKELEEYGPFEVDDMATLPAEIAELLINKERVEEIKES